MRSPTLHERDPQLGGAAQSGRKRRWQGSAANHGHPHAALQGKAGLLAWLTAVSVEVNQVGAGTRRARRRRATVRRPDEAAFRIRLGQVIRRHETALVGKLAAPLADNATGARTDAFVATLSCRTHAADRELPDRRQSATQPSPPGLTG
jgi:hypothetical protein